MTQYILAHDLGTSGNKATLYGLDGILAASVLCEYPTFTPHPGWVEQNPDDWWQAVCTGTQQLLQKAGVQPGQVAAISFSAQMMGCLLVDAKGQPLRNMIIWADTRAAKQEKEMEELLGMEFVYRTTGHRISASYSAAKLLWVRENEPEVYAKAAKMLHAKDYIIHKLCGQFVTDYSDASGTNLFDINTKEWSMPILQALDINPALLPNAYPSATVAGGVSTRAAAETGLLQGTPVVIGGGDGSCACVGAGVVKEGTAYNVLGSSSWISLASKTPVYDKEMRTFNWVHLDENLYTPCGTMQAAGYSYQWYKNVLCGAETHAAAQAGSSPYKLIDEGAAQAKPGAGGLLYLPYLLGERSPRWNHEARGAFVGLSVNSSKGDISRAVLEGVGFNLRVILDILRAGHPIQEITMIGGGAKGAVWLQILADIWQLPLQLPTYREEATSMGAAICGGVAIGAYQGYNVIEKMNKPQQTVQPNPKLAPLYNNLYAAFNTAYQNLVPTYTQLAAFNQAYP
ncbi:xylulokinase [Ruminococcaceae bacterium OttesenSCG-928-A16]|nr:xylulokinase [Ruminococcaceae bacterium OttesenSCG-928-A16]